MGEACDVAVVGSGPAGLAVAAAAAHVGLDVVVVAPGGWDRPWVATYGAWHDELAGLHVGGVAVDGLTRSSSPTTLVQGRRHLRRVARGYVVLDGAALQAAMVRRIEAAGGRAVDAVAAVVDHDAAGSRLAMVDGTALRATVVVDATGAAGALLERRRRPGGPPTWQVAHGLVASFDHPPLAQGEALLMDWSPPGGVSPGDPPTFLYAVPLGGGRVLVEETALATPTSPGVDAGLGGAPRRPAGGAWVGAR